MKNKETMKERFDEEFPSVNLDTQFEDEPINWHFVNERDGELPPKIKAFINQELKNQHKEEVRHREKYYLPVDVVEKECEKLCKEDRLELLGEIEKKMIKIPKGKHVGKSWCPQCEDTGNNYALSDLKTFLNKE